MEATRLSSANPVPRQIGLARNHLKNKHAASQFENSSSTQKKRRIDWEMFWFREVLFLGVPVVLAVITLPRGDTIHTVRLAVLLATLLGLTLVNVIWAIVVRSGSGQEQKRTT